MYKVPALRQGFRRASAKSSVTRSGLKLLLECSAKLVTLAGCESAWIDETNLSGQDSYELICPLDETRALARTSREVN